MVDKNNNTLKYSSTQRRVESLSKRNSRILLTEKKKHNIIEKETLLSELNSKTIDYQKFKDYIKEKTKLNNELQEFYITDLWRKMKWRQFIYSRKSEDKFLNNIKNVFGDNIVIDYGDWSSSSQMKHFMPTKNKGIRKLIPRECFNLQGFPRDYKLPEVCDSKLYKLAGNAVSVPVVDLIVSKLANVIDNNAVANTVTKTN